jgi:hypothetical protein
MSDRAPEPHRTKAQRYGVSRDTERELAALAHLARADGDVLLALMAAMLGAELQERDDGPVLDAAPAVTLRFRAIAPHER